MIAPVPHKGFTLTLGRKPRTSGKLTVQFRCGYVDDRHAYTTDQLRWTDTGEDWGRCCCEEGRMTERQQIVTLLDRLRDERNATQDYEEGLIAYGLHEAARAIERGEHLPARPEPTEWR